MALFDVEDYNGLCFKFGGEGEIEELLAKDLVIIPGGRPAAWPFGRNFPLAADANFPACQAWLDDLWAHNVEYQATLNIPVLDAQKIAFLRMLAVRENLIDTTVLPAAKHCQYQLWRNTTAAETAVHTANGYAMPAFDPGFTAAVRARLRTQFTNIVCIVAYFFRIRGHHFLPDFEGRYNAVWRKCLTQEDNPGLAWNLIATNALHAIYPVDLDAYWIRAAEESRCAGTLKKRVNSAPAGAANAAALTKGYGDLRTCLPRMDHVHREAVEALEAHMEALSDNRWHGSVNHRMYAADRMPLNESIFGPLAACIWGALEAFAPNSALARSMALHRMAEQAPITGAISTIQIATAAKSERAALAMLE